MIRKAKHDPKRDYAYLVKQFSEQKLKERVEFLTQSVMDFIKNQNIEEYCHYRLLMIEEIVIDYFADIARLKDFHIIEKSNPIKIAAYTAYWIIRRKPIFLIKEPDDDILYKKPVLFDVNEWFGLSILISMSFNTNKRLLKDSISTEQYKLLLDNIHYHLTYRIGTPHSLELLLNGMITNPPYEIQK